MGSARAGTDRPEYALDLVPHIKSLGVGFWDLTFREVRADVVVRRDVEEFRLWAPRLGRPVFAAANAGAELCALVRPRTLGLVDRGSPGLRVIRRKDVVIGEREGVQELEETPIHNPKEPFPPTMHARLLNFPSAPFFIRDRHST